MTTLMDDLKGLYNSLTVFNEGTILSQFPKPIKVQFVKDYNSLLFEQGSNSVFSQIPVYYSLGLWEDLTDPTWLLPEDYDNLMGNLQAVIMDPKGYLLRDRTCISPQMYGFDIYVQDPLQPWIGPEIISEIRFISGKNRFWKTRISKKYNVPLINNYKKSKSKDERD